METVRAGGGSRRGVAGCVRRIGSWAAWRMEGRGWLWCLAHGVGDAPIAGWRKDVRGGMALWPAWGEVGEHGAWGCV